MSKFLWILTDERRQVYITAAAVSIQCTLTSHTWHVLYNMDNSSLFIIILYALLLHFNDLLKNMHGFIWYLCTSVHTNAVIANFF